MMSGNTVENIIMADNKEETETILRCILIELEPNNFISIGYTYDPETGKFTEPEVQETLTEE